MSRVVRVFWSVVLLLAGIAVVFAAFKESDEQAAHIAMITGGVFAGAGLMLTLWAASD